MKQFIQIIVLSFCLIRCSESPTQFPEEVLKDEFISPDGASIEFREVLKKHSGKQIVVSVWASWCKDCILGMPDLKALQSNFPDTQFLFLSVDRNEAVWKRSIAKYNLEGDHYFIPDGQKGVFGDFLNSNWIPRYMVVDTKGNIKLFKAKKTNDNKLKEALQ